MDLCVCVYSKYPPTVSPAALPVSRGTQEAGTGCELSKPQGPGDTSTVIQVVGQGREKGQSC